MSDNVGAVSVSVTPDLSDFGALLASALGPALADGVAAVGAATAEMSSVGEANVSSLAAAIESTLGAATATVADEVAAAGDAGAMMFGELGDEATTAASTIESSIGPAIADAASEVAAGTDEMVSGMDNVVQAEETVAAGADDARDSMGRFSAQGGDDVTSLADIIKGVALGNIIADGIEKGVSVALDALQSLVTALPDLGETFHRAFQQIRVGTGLTGAALEDLEASTRDVFAKTPASLSDVASTLTLLSQRLGVTGDQAENTGLQMIKLARITGTDVNQVVDDSTAIFNNFGISADKQAEQLNHFLRIAQATGVPIDKLLSSVQSSGLAFKAAGFSIDEVSAIVGNLSKVGLDAGAVQMALGRATAKAAAAGIPAREAFDGLFDTIKNAKTPMEATAAAVDSFGARSGPRLAELIRSGKLEYADLVKTIQSGGDTIDAAAKDTGTWRGALAVLGHVLQNTLQPIATAVFDGINTSIRSITPIISSLITQVGNILIPVFESLLAAGQPVWDVLDKIRVSFKLAVDALAAGGGPIGAVQAFFTNLTGSYIPAAAAADAMRNLGQAFTDAWAALQPLRDGIVFVFDTLSDAFSTFAEENPEAMLAGVAAALTLIVGPAIIAGLGLLVPLLASAATFMGGLALSVAATVLPVIAVAAAVAALVAGIKYAYENWQPFRDAVDQTATFLRENLLVAFHAVSDFVTGTVVPWVSNLISQLGNLWDVFTSGDDVIQGIAEVIDNIFGNSGALVDPIRDFATTVGTMLGSFADAGQQLADIFMSDVVPAVLELWESIKPLIAAIGEILQPIIEWMIDHWQILAGVLLAVVAPVAALVAGAALLYTKFGFVRDIVQSVVEHLEPFVSLIVGFVGGALVQFIHLVKGLVDVLTGLLTLDFGKVLDGLKEIGAAVLENLGNMGSLLIGALSGLGSILADVFRTAVTFLIEQGPGILVAVGTWFMGLPAMMLGWLGDLGSLLGGWLLAGFDWVVANGLSLLGTLLGWVLTIPIRIVQGLGALNGLLVTGIQAAFDWVVANGPAILDALATWISELPGKMLGWLGDLGGLLYDWFRQGFDWIVTQGPSLIAGLLGWFGALPGKIFDAIRGGLSSVGGAVTGIAGDIWDAIKGFVNQHLVDPVRDFKVSVLGQDFTPFKGLPYFARGGIFDTPTAGIFGEAGPEALIPLGNEARAAAVATQAGIPGMLTRQGIGATGQILNFYLTLEVDNDTTSEQVQMVVQTAGAAIRAAIPAATRTG